MDELVAFLWARLEEDEQYARTMLAVGQEQAEAMSPSDLADVHAVALGVLSDYRVKIVLDHWSASKVMPPNDLSRVLREIETKREAINKCATAEIGDSGDIGKVLLAEAILQDLATPYADHPDYREEWAADSR